MVDISKSIKSLLEQGIPEPAILRLCKNSIRNRFEHEAKITATAGASTAVLGGTSLGCLLAYAVDMGNNYQHLTVPSEALIGVGLTTLAGGAIMGYITHKHNNKAKACVELMNSINSVDDIKDKYIDGNFENYLTNFGKTQNEKDMSL